MDNGMIWIAILTLVMVGLAMVQFIANQRRRRNKK
jgi:hypothetical protein